MSAPLAKSDFVFKLATSQTYIGGDYDPTPVVEAPPAPRGVFRQIGDGLAFVVQSVKGWVARQSTLAEMGIMSDRELSDIGLSRADLPRVFDADFANDHARGRMSY